MIRNINEINTMDRRVLTPQRRMILELVKRTDKPITAKELYSLVSREDSSISLATVYRSLNFFRKIGLIEECRLGKVSGCYELKRSIEHQHIVCKCCGKVMQFESSLITELVNQLEEDHNCTIDRIQICIEGTCNECKIRQERTTM